MSISKEQFMLSQYMAILNNDYCLTAESHAQREEALQVLAEILDRVELDNVSLEQIFNAYFVCSYAVTPEKHAIKKKINAIIRSNLLMQGIKDADDLKPHPSPLDKPTCVIITNWFTSNHVMFRVFGKSMQAMREHFHCINICLHRTDYEAAQCFDHVIVAEHIGQANYVDVMKKLRELVLKQSPDIILFADIAMHPFGVMLSNLQLAPLQFTIAGHPAPAKCPTIPYFVAEDAHRNYVPDFEEEIIFFPQDEFTVREPIAAPMMDVRLQAPERLRMIVPVSLHKITYPYLMMLKHIQEETGASLHITSNVVSGNETVDALLKETVPNCTYYPALTYDDYLRLIASCDMFLMTYPFSGFSTVQDCLSQGVPGVVMNGTDMLSHQGAVMVSRTGHNSMVAYSPMDYANKAIKLAKDTSIRSTLRQNLLTTFRNRGLHLPIFAPTSPGIATAAKYLASAKGLL